MWGSDPPPSDVGHYTPSDHQTPPSLMWDIIPPSDQHTPSDGQMGGLMSHIRGGSDPPHIWGLLGSVKIPLYGDIQALLGFQTSGKICGGSEGVYPLRNLAISG